VGEKSRIDGYVVTELATSRVSIGKNTLVGPNTIIDCVSKVTIGDNVLISYECVFSDSDNHSLSYSKRKDDLENWRLGRQDWTDVNMAPILVNRGAWIGARAIILKGVTIGEGAVVGMGSVVTRDVPPFTVVAGNPAKEIRKLPEENL
jgi:acetyltransferase-like isoleucine patch superfamily enzyme